MINYKTYNPLFAVERYAYMYFPQFFSLLSHADEIWTFPIKAISRKIVFSHYIRKIWDSYVQTKNAELRLLFFNFEPMRIFWKTDYRM